MKWFFDGKVEVNSAHTQLVVEVANMTSIVHVKSVSCLFFVSPLSFGIPQIIVNDCDEIIIFKFQDHLAAKGDE